MDMNNDNNINLWLDALASNKYKQGPKGWLNDEDKGLSSLGVLCEVYQEHIGGLTKSNVTISFPMHDGKGTITTRKLISYDGSIVSVPKVVMDWVGLTTERGDYITNGYYYGERLIEVSSTLDRASATGVSFNDIRNIILSRPRGMFKK